MTRAIPRQSSRFDEHRNTSRTWPATEADVIAAQQALTRLRWQAPRLVRWIEDGAPNMTEAQHVERFGKPYKRGEVS